MLHKVYVGIRRSAPFWGTCHANWSKKKKKRVRVEQMMGKLLKTCTHARRIIVLLIFLQSGLFFCSHCCI